MKNFVYKLQSLKNGKYYIGFTTDVTTRLEFHNAGKQRSTKSRIPFKVMIN